MKLNAGAFGLAAGLTAAAVSAVCALVVALAPRFALSLLSDVVHADFTDLTRNVTLSNFFGGVLFWGLGTALVFAVAGRIYNALVGGGPKSAPIRPAE